MDKSRVKIMVVNDKPELRSIIRNYLREDGYTALTVSEDGRSALKKAQYDPVDLIVADYDLSGMNGLELLREIRTVKALQDVPFILMSSDGEQKYVAKAAELGVSGYLVKPFSQQTLLEKVNRLLIRQLNPEEVDIYYREANLLAQSGDLEAALEKYQAALDSTKQTVAAIHYRMGRAKEELGREGEAESDYLEAAGFSKMYVDPLDALGSMSLRRAEPEKAMEYLRRGADISPLNAARQLKLGEALLEAGEFEEAERAFKLSLNLDPSQTHIFNRLGISLRRQGKLAEACGYLERALEAAPDDENLLYNLSRVHFDQGDQAAALRHLKKALEINPGFVEARELAEQIRAGGGAESHAGT